MIAAMLLALLAAPAQNSPAPVQPALDANRFVRLAFYRLQAFRGMAAQRNCPRAQPERVRALDARYDALERRVVALSGPVLRDPGPDRGGGGFDGDCRMGIVLRGYEGALHDLELRLAEVGQPAAAGRPAATPPQPQASLQQSSMATMFLFFRLRYFHDAAALRRCARADPERTRALDERYEALRRRLIEQLGAARVDFRGSTPGPERGEDRDCRMGITLIGYANALGELERNMAGGAK